MGRATMWMFLGSALALALACSADDDGSSGPEDGPSAAQRDGGADAGKDGGAANDNRTSLACNPLAVATLGTCTPTQVNEIGACLETACKSELETCYGPNHLTGKYSGPCAEQGMCTSKCSCRDESCYNACPVSDACTECGRSFVACGSACVGKLGCALGDAGLALPGLERACDDLAACCSSLKDPLAKSECTTAHAQVQASGSFLCALVIPLYCL